ncbi:MAG TPA: DNA polymerase/3'-5' exonuclease PolX [Gemmatimonadales bacterium]|nr:DNA polymerase/3'-5' exonuclease PolX [Gemmatimonadales bacterium]
MMDRKGVAVTLERIASYLELQGENPFRVRAFRTAEKTVEGFPSELEAAIADGSLAEAKGIGPAILEVITELVTTGRSSLLESLREAVPPGLVEMLAISGLGVAKIRQIHEGLGIETLPELEAAARDGRLAALPRFGARTAENVLKAIAFLRAASVWRLAHHARDEATAIADALSAQPHVLAVHPAGAVRRRDEVVQEQILVVVADVAPAEVFRSIGAGVGVSEVAGQDERRATLRFQGGAPVQVVVTPPQNLGAVLVQATGNAGHLARLTAQAEARGFTLAGTALWQGSRFVPTPDEETLYAALGLPWIPPELRENGDELDRPLPTLLDRRDLRGFLHCHTTYSDGTNSVEELARGVRAAGYEWLGITDHSRSAAYAGGMQADDIRRQWDEIDAVNALDLGITVFKGIESDILADGALDYPDEVLAGFDFIIASVHSRFTMNEAEMTSRFLRAIESPYVTLIGHPTGRLLLSREGYPVDLDQLFEAAGRAGVGIEINADPHRLDLDWRVLRRARAAGVMISIGSDAHNLGGLDNVDFGVAIARKGGLGPADILNSRRAEEFLAFARARRR